MPWWDLRSLSSFKNFRPTILQDVSSERLKITATTGELFSPIDLPLIGRRNKQGFLSFVSHGKYEGEVGSVQLFPYTNGTWAALSQNEMREVQLGSHTVRSHGLTVARTHMHDWIILVLLVVIEVILYVIHPFYRFVGKNMMTDLKYPLQSNTVPVWAVPMYAILLPLFIFLIIYFRRRDIYDLHHAILGLLFSVLVTAVITDAIKNAVGRPRPDFFWRCFPDGKDVYDKLGNVICHGDKNVIKEGHKSFPSGHTSWSFAGLGFFSLYLSGKIRAFDRRGHVAKLCIVFLPLLFACLVGISRVDDYWHHWQDVFAGGLIGLTVATFCYLQFFPPPYHPQGWGPYAYFRVLEESRASTQADSNINPHNVNAVPTVMEDREDESNGSMGLHLPTNSGSVEDVECGRRQYFT